MDPPLLKVRGLKTTFSLRGSFVDRLRVARIGGRLVNGERLRVDREDAHPQCLHVLGEPIGTVLPQSVLALMQPETMLFSAVESHALNQSACIV